MSSYFFIKMQLEDGKIYSFIYTIQGVLRPAFQMVFNDDILVKNSFRFQLAEVLANDAVIRDNFQRTNAKVSKSLCMIMWCTVSIMKWSTYFSYMNANL